ncbi:tetratricopeptide repeat protein [Tropicimonas sp. S265A]|uniref:tetratricopeptide repeat protein n=1 Tax=Tropicimonas sp. S265A TaxID=3415134 RepID=UPI003C7A013B
MNLAGLRRRARAAIAAVLLLAAPVHGQSLAPDLNDPAQIEQVFRAGLSALNAGNSAAAVQYFTAILARDPSLTRVRLELGRAYLAAGEYGRARAEFLVALSGDLPAPVRQNVLGFIREIDARRGFEWAAEIALTEVGESRDFESDTLDLDFGFGPLPFTLNRDDTTRPGLEYALEATMRAPRGTFRPDTALGSLFGTLSLNGVEASGSELDETILGFRTGILRAAPQVTYGAALEGFSRFNAGRHTENRLGISVQAERRFATGQTVFGVLRGSEISHQRDNSLDGTLVFAVLGTQRPFSSRGSIGAEILAERQNVDNPLEDTRRYGLRAFASLDVRGGFTLRPSLLLEQRRFVNPSPLLTGNPDEDSIEAALRIEKNDLFFAGGFSPFLTLEARRTKSGIDAFSYRESGVRFGFESRF